MVWRFEVGLIVVWAGGRLKWIALPGAAAFAASIASRKVQFVTVHVPSPGSAFELTTNGLVCVGSVTVVQVENSDVSLLALSVAVAVIASPTDTDAERPVPVSIE